MEQAPTKYPPGVYARKGSRLLWISYSYRGRAFRESTKTTNPKKAEALRRQRLSALEAGHSIGPKQDRVTVVEVLDAYMENRKLAGKKALKNIRQRCHRLKASSLGALRALDITLPRLEAWANERIGHGSARATVKTDLGYLRAALYHARRARMIAVVPDFPTLTVNNARRGFFEADEFDAVRTALRALKKTDGPLLADIATFAYISGWRLEEILGLPWAEVDRRRGVITLPPERSKNNRDRTLPLFGELGTIIERRWQARVVPPPRGHHPAARTANELSAWVFHRHGRRVWSIRQAWNRACQAAGVPRIFHDLRRTAVRNLIDAGVDRATAKSITGHVTDAVFERYGIRTVENQRRALERLSTSTFLAQSTPPNLHIVEVK
jgi:integrase